MQQLDCIQLLLLQIITFDIQISCVNQHWTKKAHTLDVNESNLMSLFYVIFVSQTILFRLHHSYNNNHANLINWVKLMLLWLDYHLIQLPPEFHTFLYFNMYLNMKVFRTLKLFLMDKLLSSIALLNQS